MINSIPYPVRAIALLFAVLVVCVTVTHAQNTPTAVPTGLPRVTPTPLDRCGTNADCESGFYCATNGEHAVLYWKMQTTLVAPTPAYHHTGDFGNPLATTFVLPFDGKLRRLSVHCDGTIVVGSQIITVMVGGSTTVLACTLNVGDHDCTNNTQTVSFSALDDINLRSLSGSALSTKPDCTATAEVTDPNSHPYPSIVSWGGGGAAASLAPESGMFCGPGGDADDITECLGVNGNSLINAAGASFIVPRAATISGLGVRQSRAMSGTYVLHNVTTNRDVGMSVVLGSEDTKLITTTCTHDCTVEAGDLVTVRLDGPDGTEDYQGNRNVTVTLTNIGQVDTSRRNEEIIGTGTGFGNFHSPWQGTTNVYRAERDAIIHHLAVQVPIPVPAEASMTVTICEGSNGLPRTCTCTAGLECTLHEGDTTCVDDVHLFYAQEGTLYTARVSVVGSSGGAPAFAVELSDPGDVSSAGCIAITNTPTPLNSTTPTTTPTPTITETPTPTQTPTNTITPGGPTLTPTKRSHCHWHNRAMPCQTD